MNKQPLRVLMMPTLVPAIVHYRMATFVNELRKYDDLSVAFTYNPTSRYETCKWEKNLLKNKRFISEMEALCTIADVVVFQSVHTFEALSLMDALRAKYPKLKIVAEYDDSLFAVPSYNPSQKAFALDKHVVQIGKEQIYMADAVIVSTEYLKNEFESYNKKIFVVKNCIDFNDRVFKRPPKRHPKRSRIRLGWCGGGAHDGDLKILRKVLPKILKKYPNVEFSSLGGITSDFFDKVTDSRLRQRIKTDEEWHNIEDHLYKLKRKDFDIGLAPIRDNEFNRSKSHLRILEYSALKIPTIASAVDPYVRFHDESKGSIMLVRETKEKSLEEAWIEAIEKLINDEKLRNDLARKAHTFVKENYSTQVVAQQYREVLKEISKYEPKSASVC